MYYTLGRETPGDIADIDTLIETAFGPGRFERTIMRFRRGRAPISAFGHVARTGDGTLAGSIRFWPVLLPDGSQVPMLGPLAVDPAIRGLGVGRALVRLGIDEVQAAGEPALLIVGDPGYYAPFGFSVATVRDLDIGGPTAPLTLMGLEFTPGTLSHLSGTVEPVPA
jgi:predicted N-acetyltransferase YhbS